jgi:hypothetical protein
MWSGGRWWSGGVSQEASDLAVIRSGKDDELDCNGFLIQLYQSTGAAIHVQLRSLSLSSVQVTTAPEEKLVMLSLKILRPSVE